MGKLIDLTGQKFNRLTVIERDLRDKRKGTYWYCKCDCGNFTSVLSNYLRNGNTKSCGCLQKEKARENGGFKNLTGQKFGRLLVLEYTAEKKNRSCAYWKCLCDCGKEIITSSNELLNGHTQSCGCLRLEKLREAIAKDITGLKFGKLTVLEVDETYQERNNIQNRKLYWKCQCDCGSIVSVEGTHLRRGEIQSCGCVISRGEEKISELLTQNNIVFEKQKVFESCRFENGYLARFDFWVDNSFLVEFDGIQHYSSIGYWGGEQTLEKTQNRDIIKNQWCKDNKIPLKRIPYWALDTLTLEDILGDKFLLKE